MRWFAVLALGLICSACSTAGLVETAYPDRVSFQFLNSNKDEVLSYRCAQGTSEAETRRRAQAAHTYFDSGIEAAAERAAERLLCGDDAPTFGDSLAVTRQLDREAETLVQTTEARYQCLFYDARDV